MITITPQLDWETINISAEPCTATQTIATAAEQTTQRKPFTQRRMLTVPETAKRLELDGYGVKQYTLERWTRQGMIPCVHAGRKRLLNYDVVCAFLNGGASQ